MDKDKNLINFLNRSINRGSEKINLSDHTLLIVEFSINNKEPEDFILYNHAVKS